MATKGRKALEKELYDPVKRHLEDRFRQKFGFGNCYLEITADGSFSDTLKSFVRHDIVFSFLGKKASPDLAGFIIREGAPPLWAPTLSRSDIKDFITVEIKREKIAPQDIYQAKMYGDLFQAKYALLISPEPIPEEIRRLNQNLFVTYRFMSGWYLHIGQWFGQANSIAESRWLPHSPFRD